MRHIGVSNFDVEQLRRTQRIALVETLQPHGFVDDVVDLVVLATYHAVCKRRSAALSA